MVIQNNIATFTFHRIIYHLLAQRTHQISLKHIHYSLLSKPAKGSIVHVYIYDGPAEFTEGTLVQLLLLSNGTKCSIDNVPRSQGFQILVTMHVIVELENLTITFESIKNKKIDDSQPVSVHSEA